jgi:hypothetical protein
MPKWYGLQGLIIIIIITICISQHAAPLLHPHDVQQRMWCSRAQVALRRLFG